MTQYDYSKQVHPELLEDEIEASSITIALDHIDTDSTPSSSVFFKADLSAGEKTELDTIVNNHDMSNYVPQVATVQAELLRAEEDDKIPYVYSSPRPMNHYSYFTSKGDGTYDPNGATYADMIKFAEGPQVLFDMKATDVSKTIDITYNEIVYLKDGLMLPKNAPMGAHIDMDIIHPVAGYLLSFGKAVPVIGDYPISMNTEDRAYLVQGLIIRFTCVNATGQNGHDAAADFKLMGRLELYRPKPPGT